MGVFISVINQLDVQTFCFTISIFHASTCFEHICSSSGGQNCITQPVASSHLWVAVWCTGWERTLKNFFLVCYIYLINLKFWSGKEILCETPCWPVDIQHAKLPVYYFQVCWECKVVGARLVHVKVAPLSVPLMPTRAWTFRPMLKDLTVLDTESAQSPCPCWESNPCFSATLVTVCLQSAMWRPF